MSGFGRLIKLELSAQTKLRERYLQEIEKLPEGYLLKNKTGKSVYLQYMVNGKRRSLSARSDDDVRLAQRLRRKRFLEKMVKTLENNIKVLKLMSKRYKPIDPAEISSELAEAYQIPPGNEEEVPWFYPDKAVNVNFKSKSEMSIMLAYESRGFDVQYERMINVKGVWLHPDFTIMEMSEHELIFHEHLGMIDKRGYYRRSVVERLLDLWDVGIRLGENLILTFEDDDHPLSLGAFERVIDLHFAGRLEEKGRKE